MELKSTGSELEEVAIVLSVFVTIGTCVGAIKSKLLDSRITTMAGTVGVAVGCAAVGVDVCSNLLDEGPGDR